MFRPRRGRLRGQSFNKMIPNILTMLALCAGLTALRFGLEENWEAAVLSLVVAAVLDALDGRVARLLRGTSKFGAELDSLSDFIGFGVAPALLLYLWTMKDAGPIGWVMVLLFGICCALRLARFQHKYRWSRATCLGQRISSLVYRHPPEEAWFCCRLILSFQVDSALVRDPLVVGLTIVAVAFLLVSRLPTFSFKNFRVSQRFVLPTMLLVGLVGCFFCQRTLAHANNCFMLLYCVNSFCTTGLQKVRERSGKTLIS